MRRALLLAALAVSAGCGAQKPATDAAELVQRDARGLVTVRGDLAPLERVPFLARRVRALKPYLRGRVGPEVDVAFLRGGGVLGLTHPTDEKRFAAQLDRRGWAHVRRRGWTLYARSPNALRREHGALADRPAYREAVAALPSDAIVRSYRIPATAAVTKHGDDVRVDVLRRREGRDAALVAPIPASAGVAVGLAQPTTLLGVDVRALGGPAVAWAKPGRPFPSVTIVAVPTRARAALRAVGRAVGRLAGTTAPPVVERVGDITYRHLALGAIDLYWALERGRIVVTDDPAAAAEHGDELDLSALPARTTRWIYVDERALPAAQELGRLLHVTLLHPAAIANLAPLRSLLAWETRNRAGAIVRSR